MPWQPGQSGNPGGRPPKRFLAAVERAIAQDDGERLRKCAENLLDMAAAGEQWAVALLADRLDGKAVQQTEIGGIENAPPVTVEVIFPVAAKSGD